MVEDSYVQLPPTIQQETVCVMENPAQKLISLFVELFNLSDLRVESEEKDDLFKCLKFLLQPHINADQKKWFPKVRTLPFHFMFQPATWKLLFIKYLVRFLKHNKRMVQEILKTHCWQAVYNKQHNGGKDYNIASSIKENTVFVMVYEFGAAEEIDIQQNAGEQNEEKPARGQLAARARYHNTGAGVLTLIGNIIFHANDHRLRLNLRPWTDEELEALIEHSFPGEMLHGFTFCWLTGLPIDYGKSLYVLEEGKS